MRPSTCLDSHFMTTSRPDASTDPGRGAEELRTEDQQVRSALLGEPPEAPPPLVRSDRGKRLTIVAAGVIFAALLLVVVFSLEGPATTEQARTPADNVIELIIGPIENYEDRLFNYKAAFEAYVLIKDVAWSKKLARFAERKGLYDNTIVLYSTDNGPHYNAWPDGGIPRSAVKRTQTGKADTACR